MLESEGCITVIACGVAPHVCIGSNRAWTIGRDQLSTCADPHSNTRLRGWTSRLEEDSVALCDPVVPVVGIFERQTHRTVAGWHGAPGRELYGHCSTIIEKVPRLDRAG